MFSFTSRKKAVAAERHIRRLIDLTIPNNASAAVTDRDVNRLNRSIPALLCPWENNQPVVSKATVVVTKDIVDRGVGLILNHPYEATHVVLGFSIPDPTVNEPWFFRGTKRSNVAIGGGFWLLGIELNEFMNEDWRAELEPLRPMARKLLPHPLSGQPDSTAVLEELVAKAIELG